MLRPGRLDAVITIDAPDAEAALRLAKNYAGSLWNADEDYGPIGQSLEGKSAAVIREVVERAKLYAIGEVPEGEDFHLTAASLADSAATMDRQLALLNPKVEEPSTVGEQFMDAIAERVSARLSLTDMEAAVQGAGALAREVSQTKGVAQRTAAMTEKTMELAAQGARGSEKTAKQVEEIHDEVCR
jgi:SpoVK/Ycf46/Vps4 family AAA+-type ATPase